MKVAVAYNNGQIGEHFGHAECFAIYDYQDTNVDSCVKKLIDCTDRHGHQAMADLMRENDVDAVIVSQMGDEARALLLSAGIVPVLGYCGGADMAADMLVSGLLQKFLSEADESRTGDSHAAASARIRREFAGTDQANLPSIQARARELLHAHTKELEVKYGH